MLRLKESTLLCALLLSLGACKVTVNSTSADEARPNPGADAADDAATAPKPADGGEDEAPAEGGDEPEGEPTDAPKDPSTTLTSQAPVTCEDGKYKPGDTWKADCNTCNCNENGKTMCTRMACRDSVE